MRPEDILQLYGQSTGLDQAQQAFSLRGHLLQHQRFRQVMCLISELHIYSRTNQVGGGLLITGPSGVGKSTLLTHYQQLFPKDHAAQQTHIPVLLVTSPSSPTVKSFSEALLLALGDPMARRGSAEEKTFRIYQLLKVCNVELLIIDEFQHFYYAHSVVEFRRISDWLKILISQSGVAVVLAGLPEAEIVIYSNEQLSRRFSSRYVLSRFTLENEADFAEFRAILKKLQEALPLAVETPLHEANLARRFLVASHGLLDYVRKILEGAVAAATAASCLQLNLATYAAGFRNQIWADTPDRINPFHPESPLRPLTRDGEPYYNGEKRNAIGSPLARRSIMAKRTF